MSDEFHVDVIYISSNYEYKYCTLYTYKRLRNGAELNALDLQSALDRVYIVSRACNGEVSSVSE
jgi:hypothetical protein